MNNKQIILCVESNKRAQTDNIYIKETIGHFFEIGNEVNIQFVNMGNKDNYKSRAVLNQINEFIRDYKIGKSIVIYCIDLDQYEADPVQAKENENIEAFVKGNGYELIWFSHDIEEVYLGKKAEKGEKVKLAIDFKKRGLIKDVPKARLSSKKVAKGKSNILDVLSKCIKNQ